MFDCAQHARQPYNFIKQCVVHAADATRLLTCLDPMSKNGEKFSAGLLIFMIFLSGCDSAEWYSAADSKMLEQVGSTCN